MTPNKRCLLRKLWNGLGWRQYPAIPSPCPVDLGATRGRQFDDKQPRAVANATIRHDLAFRYRRNLFL